MEDFDKTVPSATKHTSGPTVSGDKTRATSRPENSATNVEQSSSSSAANHNDTSSGLGGNVAQDIGNAMRTMLGDSPDLLAQLDQIAQAAAGAEHGTQYQIRNSSFLSLYISYRNSGENLLKDQENLT